MMRVGWATLVEMIRPYSRRRDDIVNHDGFIAALFLLVQAGWVLVVAQAKTQTCKIDIP